MNRWSRLKKALIIFAVMALFLTAAAGNVFARDNLVERLQGSDRYDTAANIATYVYQSADTVIIARGDDFADGLAGNVLAGAMDAPILLTSSDVLPEPTREAIEELEAEEAIILGGEAAVSSRVEGQLETQTRRIAGASRYDTAVRIAKEASRHTELADYALVVNGTAYADAMAVGTVAGMENVPLLQVREENLPRDTKQAIKEDLEVDRLVLIGGEAVISEDVYMELGALVTSMERVAGVNRYATSVEVANRFFDELDCAVFVGGLDANLPDALVGGYLGAFNEAPLLYVRHRVPDEVENYLSQAADENTRGYAVGGGRSVQSSVIRDIENIIRTTFPWR